MPTRITDDTRARLPKAAADLEHLERLCIRLRRVCVAEADMTVISPVAIMPAKFHNLLQIGLRRTLELTDALIREFNASSFTPVLVLTRAVFETGVLLLDASLRVRELVENRNKSGLDELDKYLMDVLLGSKAKARQLHGDYQARNIVTIIERVTKKLGVPFDSMYGDLSEHAHPNYMGMMAVYQAEVTVGDPIVKFFDSAIPDDVSTIPMRWASVSAVIALEMVQDAYEAQQRIHERFRSVCEEAIHDGGTWPPDVPYPLTVPKSE